MSTMFKRLRDRLTEEANRFPVGQAGGKSVDASAKSEAVTTDFGNTENLITLNDSPAVIIPHSITSSEHFSIADEEEFLSDQSSPQKIVPKSSSELLVSSIPFNDENLSNFTGHSNSMIAPSSFVPQSDIETEAEDPPIVNLEIISKEHLFAKIVDLKARKSKYKNEYSKIVGKFKELQEENKKLENAFTKNQDQSLRRMAELREQYQLEQKAKADLEGNLRLILDEKDSRISVLETQITLLKESQIDDSCSIKQYATSSSMTDDVKILEKLDSSVKENATTGVSEEVANLLKENEYLNEEIINLTKTLETNKENQYTLCAQYDLKIKLMKDHLNKFSQLRESHDMSIAEIKQNMHKELDLKDYHIKNLNEEIQTLNLAVQNEKRSTENLQKQYDQKLNEVRIQYETLERTVEEDKQAHELVLQEKGNAIALLQQAHENKICTLENENRSELDALHVQLKIAEDKLNGEQVLLKKIEILEYDCATFYENLNQKQNIVSQLSEENRSLKDINRQIKLESEQEIMASLKLKYSEEKEELLKKNTELESKIITLQHEICNMEENVNLLKDEKNDMKIKEMLLEYEHEICQLKQKNGELEDDVVQKENNFDSELSVLNDQNQLLSEKIILLQNICDAKETELSDKQLLLSIEVQKVFTIQEHHNMEVQRLKKEIEDLLSKNCELETLRQEVHYYTSEIYGLKEDLDSLQKEKNSLTENCMKIKEKIPEYEFEICQLKQKNEILGDDIAQKENCFNSELSVLNDQNKLFSEKLISLQELHNAKETELNNKEVLLCIEKENAATIQKNHRIEVQDLNKRIQDLLSENCELKKLTKDNSNTITELKENLGKEKLINEGSINLKQENAELMEKIHSYQMEVPEVDQNELVKDKLNKLDKENQCMRKVLIHSGVISNIKELSEIMKLPFESEDFHKYVETYYCNKMYVENQALKSAIDYLQSKVKNYEALNDEEILTEHNRKLKQTISVDSDYESKLNNNDLSIVQSSELNVSSNGTIKEENSKTEKTLEKGVIFNKSENETIMKSDLRASENLESVHCDVSDWDDSWIIPEDSFDPANPVCSCKEDCTKYVKDIEELQKELLSQKCEVKDLRLLLRLTPPESLNADNDSSYSLPEPTELEYLKNIIYHYMLGKETSTLAKVIAAVLKFDDEQKTMIMEKEKSKQFT